jgi:tetratricopeptide (TPR) repeat protein
MRKKKVTSEGRFSELMEEAQFYFLNQNYDEAQRLLEEALKIKPDACALYTLGLIFEIKNEKEKAQEMYRSALELEPNLKEAEEHLAKILKG